MMLGNRECGMILTAQKGNTAEKIVLVFLGIYLYENKFCFECEIWESHMDVVEERSYRRLITLPYIYIYIQGVTGGMDKTSGECSLC